CTSEGKAAGILFDSW
nr:immunoglobulin heavy chain junction region [Macaca mulatta]MOW25346.1 immunoglobulin heavy chain junction region [Macaca mulatta]MOW25928.1 immunoglobulin heavy chain junction region [Macaca mulatta]